MKNSIALSMVFLALFLFSCAKEEKQPAPLTEAIPVRLAEIRYEAVNEPARSVGILTAKEESKLSFKIGGIIEKIAVKEGENVVAGQLLATLRPDEINAQTAQAKAAVEKSERDLLRVRNLHRDSIATLEQVQDASTGVTVAKSTLEIAQFNRKYAGIYAPSAGTVLKRVAQEHEIVGAGMPILLISNRSKGWVIRTGLADRDVVRVKIGDTATVHFDAFPGQTFKARVSEIAGVANPMSGTFDVELSISAEKDVRFVSGLVAQTEVRTTQAKTMALVPIEAFVEGEKQTGFVFVVDGGKARKIPVRVSHIQGKFLAVFAENNALKQVITDGASYLSDGMAVKVVQ